MNSKKISYRARANRGPLCGFCYFTVHHMVFLGLVSLLSCGSCHPVKDHQKTGDYKEHYFMNETGKGSCDPFRGSCMNPEELKKKMTREQYHVTQENGTERPFENAYWNNKQPGIYVDLVSGDVLFSSLEKYDSGSGWPSFMNALEKQNLVEVVDEGHGMIRTEIRAKKSNSHLGHLFDDGPEPTGQRYCINSAAIRFIPAEELVAEGYADYSKLFQEALNSVQLATFGAGCFWGVEAVFRKVDGVRDTAVGYLGGTLEKPTYGDVCSGNTGHAEVVQVRFDPNRVSYAELLELFWKIHDPTTLNRQGPDRGSQYRSAIFYHSDAQEAIAVSSMKTAQESGRFKREIVTEITPTSEFFRAEEYHQQYIEKQGGSSCHTPGW